VRLFSGANASASTRVAQPVHHAVPADNVWQRVVYGNEDGVLQMLRVTPRLVEQKATVTDYSNRAVNDATPFQMALRAGDEIMAKKIKAIYLAANPGEGQAVLDAQFNEAFPNGYAAHLEEQKRSADEFERNVLNSLVAAFYRASVADLKSSLRKRDNGSELCRKLREFKDAFHALSMQEKVYNPNHLRKVFQEYDDWYDDCDNGPRWLQSNLFWRQVIGWEERYMTANYAQSFCTGLDSMVNYHRPLQRTLTLHNYDTFRDIHLYPLDVDPNSKLGSDFGAYSYYEGVGQAPSRVWRDGAPFKNLCREKAARLAELCSQNLAAGIRPDV